MSLLQRNAHVHHGFGENKAMHMDDLPVDIGARCANYHDLAVCVAKYLDLKVAAEPQVGFSGIAGLF